MTYKPEFEVGPKSPGVWKELRRLERQNEALEAALRFVLDRGPSAEVEQAVLATLYPK